VSKEDNSNGRCPETFLEQARDGWHVKLGLLDFGPMPEKEAKQFYRACQDMLAELSDANEDIDFEKIESFLPKGPEPFRKSDKLLYSGHGDKP
jgi:hypothetical protein